MPGLLIPCAFCSSNTVSHLMVKYAKPERTVVQSNSRQLLTKALVVKSLRTNAHLDHTA